MTVWKAGRGGLENNVCVRVSLIRRAVIIQGVTMHTFLGSLPEFKCHSESLSHR